MAGWWRPAQRHGQLGAHVVGPPALEEVEDSSHRPRFPSGYVLAVTSCVRWRLQQQQQRLQQAQRQLQQELLLGRDTGGSSSQRARVGTGGSLLEWRVARLASSAAAECLSVWQLESSTEAVVQQMFLAAFAWPDGAAKSICGPRLVCALCWRLRCAHLPWSVCGALQVDVGVQQLIACLLYITHHSASKAALGLAIVWSMHQCKCC